MIKFKVLIHKETGKVIPYEEWLKMYSCDNGIVLKIENGLKYPYDAEEMIFSADFIIVYDNEFTTKELIKLTEEYGLDLETKINELIGEREYLKFNYNVDL